MRLPDRFVWRPRDVLRGFGEALDLVPYIAVLAWPFVLALWALGTPGVSNPDSDFEIWWTRGLIAIGLYVVSMLTCAIVEWQAVKRGWRWMRLGVRVFRWVHFLLAFGPIIVLFALIVLPPAWLPF